MTASRWRGVIRGVGIARLATWKSRHLRGFSKSCARILKGTCLEVWEGREVETVALSIKNSVMEVSATFHCDVNKVLLLTVGLDVD